jgi:hypothetical protein
LSILLLISFLYLIDPTFNCKNLFLNLPDFYTRIKLNDFTLNITYFYWTNFWFVLPFISVIISTYVVIWARKFNNKIALMYLFIMIYLISLPYYVGFNTLSFCENFQNENLNTLLTNSINKYHPLIFYISIVFLVRSFYDSWQQFYVHSNNEIIKTIDDNLKTPIFTQTLILTMSLGGWWALQEGSWGGWWNWDPSETFGLTLLIFYITNLHNWMARRLWIWNRSILKIKVTIFFMFYLLIQLNFDLISHNFGTRTHQFVNSYYSYLIGLIVSTLILSINTSNLAWLIFEARKFMTKFFVWTTTLITILSVVELFINSIWTLLNFNIINFNLNLQYLVFLLVCSLIIYFFEINIFVIIFLLLVPSTFQSFKLILITSITLFNFNFAHKLIYLWMFLSVTFINSSVLVWDLGDTSKATINNFKYVFNDYVSLKTTSPYIEFLGFSPNGCHFDNILWSFSNNSPVTMSQIFSHLFQTSKLNQALKPFYLEFNHLIHIIDHTLPCLSLLIVGWVCNLTLLFDTRKVIIF